MEARMIPKSQIERVVGPILSMFLEEVLTETFQNDPNLSGRIVMICPEFPLKKSDNRQSTNIDWLMYNPERRQLLFVELKTSDTSVNPDQIAIYQAKRDAIFSKGGSFLINDIKQLRDASKESGKYQYILETKVLLHKEHIATCHDAKIIYLVPKSALHKIDGHADKVISFGELSGYISGSYSNEWLIIRNYLCTLDDSSQRSRNLQFMPRSYHPVNKNSTKISISSSNDNNQAILKQSKFWQGTLKFPDMYKLCLQLGDDVIIGFTGGKEAFSTSSLAGLQSRLFYRWDYSKNMAGKKQSDWLPGSLVLEILKSNHNYSNK